MIKSADVGPPIPLQVPQDPQAGLRTYPSDENTQPLAPPRWWHWSDRALFASVIRVNFSGAYFLVKGDQLPAVQGFDSMAPSEAQAVLDLLAKAGQQAMIAKILAKDRRAGLGLQKTTEHGLAEADLAVSEIRDWFDGFDLIRGHLTHINESLIQVMDESGKEHHIGVGRSCEGDNAFIMAFLEKHKMFAIRDKMQQERAAKPYTEVGQASINGESRSWNVRGTMVDAQLVMYAFRGIELRGADGVLRRVKFTELTDADADYLLQLAKQDSSRRALEVSLSSRNQPASGDVASSGFRPSFQGPGFTPPIRPDFSQREPIVIPDSSRKIQERVQRTIAEDMQRRQQNENPAYSAGRYTGIAFLVILVIAVVRQVMTRTN